ncbi:DBH like monooxygenase olf413 isoform X2 [Augochlora pura]
MKTVIASCFLPALVLISGVLSVDWKHSAALDDKFLVLWTPSENDIMFEIQVRTLGYMGFGFSKDGDKVRADMVIGWVDNNGQLHLQDRHVKDASKDPEMDSSQDYFLLLGYENKTHTVLRFFRRYDTCDPRDFKITVHLPMNEDTLHACRIVKMPNIHRKHHVVKYEPVIQPGSHHFLHHMTLYECRGDPAELESAASTSGSLCYQPSSQPSFQCTTIAAIWSLGSEGFNYPLEAGYPLDPHDGPRYYMLETHYTNPELEVDINDSSGLRLHYTDRLRTHDAGILSVGIDPNWRHTIPPGQPEVVSEGHCISDCTGQTIPNNGINIFAVVMHTHQLGRKVRLRQIRSGEELPPIASDTNYDPTYQEYRKLQKPVRVYPGDHLITECTYSTESRKAITLGGLTMRHETCLVSTLYYPRIELSLCYSLPSLPTVLQSLGIQKLQQRSSPVTIEEPQELKGMTLEERLTNYDWVNKVQNFVEATRGGTITPLCSTSKGTLPGTANLDVHYPRILRPYEDTSLPCSKKTLRNKLSMSLSEDADIGASVDPNSEETNAVERGQLVRSKVSRSSDGPAAGSSSARSVSLPLVLAAATILVGAAFR